MNNPLNTNLANIDTLLETYPNINNVLSFNDIKSGPLGNTLSYESVNFNDDLVFSSSTKDIFLATKETYFPLPFSLGNTKDKCGHLGIFKGFHEDDNKDIISHDFFRYHQKEIEKNYSKDFKSMSACCKGFLNNVILAKSNNNNYVGFKGVLKCKSNFCPYCGKVILLNRCEEIQRAVEVHLSKSLFNDVVMLTLTCGHSSKYTKDFKKLYLTPEFIIPKIVAAKKMFLKSRAWKTFKKELSQIGCIQSFEIMVSLDSGLHPHYHFILFLEKKMSVEDRNFWIEKLFNSWNVCLNKNGLNANLKGKDKLGNEKYLGLLINSRNDISKYITKISQEMSGNLKFGRNGSLSLWGIIWKAFKTNDNDLLDLYFRILKAMKINKRLVSLLYWSPNLKKNLGIKERSDSEIVEEENNKLDNNLYEINTTDYNTKIHGTSLKGYIKKLVKQNDYLEIEKIFNKFDIHYVKLYDDFKLNIESRLKFKNEILNKKSQKANYKNLLIC